MNHPKPFKLLNLLLVTLGTLSLLGCQELRTAELNSTREKVIKLMDEQRYEESIFLLEPIIAEQGEDHSLAPLLAQAHLGMARFEPLNFSSQVLGPQPTEDSWARLAPQCTTQAMSWSEKPKAFCLMIRLMRHFPDADEGHLARARNLFRKNRENMNETPAAENFLIGAVETGSALSRLGKMLLALTQSANEVISAVSPLRPNQFLNFETAPSAISAHPPKWYFLQVSELIVEADQALKRAYRSHHRISQTLLGVRDVNLFEGIEFNLHFIEETGLPSLLRLQKEGADALESELTWETLENTLRGLLEHFKETPST